MEFQEEGFGMSRYGNEPFVQESLLDSSVPEVNNTNSVESKPDISSLEFQMTNNEDMIIPSNVRKMNPIKMKSIAAALKARKSTSNTKKNLGKGYHWPKESIGKLIMVWDRKIIDLFTRKRHQVYKEINEILLGMGVEATPYIIRLKLNNLTSTYKRKIRKDQPNWIYFNEVHSIFNKLRAYDPVLATNFLDKCEKFVENENETHESERIVNNSLNDISTPEIYSNNQYVNTSDNIVTDQGIKQEDESSSECPVNEDHNSEATQDAPEVPKSEIPCSSEENSNIAAQNFTEENSHPSPHTSNNQEIFEAKEKRRTRSKSPDTTTGRSYEQQKGKRSIQDRILEEMKKANDLAEYELRESSILLNKAHHLEEKRLQLTEQFVRRSMAIQETLITFMNYHHQGGSF